MKTVPLENVIKEFSFFKLKEKDDKKRSYYHDSPYEEVWASNKKIPNGTYIIGEEISTGGSSGGNCWDDSPSVEYTSDNEINITKMIKALGRTGLIDLKTMSYGDGIIFEESITTINRFENEYYGNHTYYQLKGFKVVVRETNDGQEVYLCE